LAEVSETTTNAAVPRPADLKPGKTDRGTIAEWTVTVLLLLFGTTTLVQAFVIPTGSMEDNLLVGDHLLVDKLAYAPHGPISKYLLPYQEIKRGDIVVFRYPVDIKQTFVKRVIGVPGDRVRLENKQVILNGKRIPEPYKVHKTDFVDSYRDNFPSTPYLPVSEGAVEMLEKNVKAGDIIVPPNAYFVMGDNRDNSLDSRYWGFVPRSNIIGKPLIIYWSYDTSTERLAGSIFNIEHLIDLVKNFGTKTRWRRTFKLIHAYDHEKAPAAAAATP
jgi:signal peptidase I